jgi:chromosome segregation ATPase
VLRHWRREIVFSHEAFLLCTLLLRRSQCRFFGIWESEFRQRLTNRACTRQHKAESRRGARLPDLLGRLHGLASRQAELETALEMRDSEIGDVRAVIAENELQLARLAAERTDASQERDRVQGLRDGVDRDYRDQIADLRMALSREIDTRRERIDAGRQRLKLQMRAKQITSETIGESQESLHARIGGIRERLAAAQSVAVHFRDALIAAEAEQAAAVDEIAAHRREIVKLSKECEGIAQKAEGGQDALAQGLESLNNQYQGAIEELGQARKCVERYNDELIDQDGKIEILTRELALARQRYRTALTAFTDDGEL